MATSEIEKLERRYAENPHGLTFAPLAEVHRKNGDVARALELLTAGLELHPNYIPASIVLGRCHQDLGDLPAAEAAFAHVLRLDDENVIALKSLADISERLERFEDAESWLRRLVSVDRSNEEAREQLHRVELARNGPSPPHQLAAGEPEAALATEDAAPRQTPEHSAPDAVASDLPPMDLAALDLEPEVQAPPAAEPVPDSESPAPAEALTPQGLAETHSAEPPPLALERTPEFSDHTAEAVPLITKPAAAAEAEPVAPVPGLISQEFEAPEEPRAPAAPLDMDVETSQEVVLNTGSDPEFRIPNASEELAADATAPAHPSYSARETKGQSVAAFFREMLAARPPGETGPGPQPPQDSEGSAPGRPVESGLSLRSVLGQDKPEPAGADVSFDDFFGSQSKDAAGDKSADPGNDDLDQFQSWLQNLKR